MAFKPTLSAKRWRSEYEQEISKFWEEIEAFKFDKESGKPVYVIDTPPPYTSGRFHLGGAIHYSQIDMVARYRRMQGKEVIFPHGVDRNGLPIEVRVEQDLGISMHEMDRAEFMEKCREELDEFEKNTEFVLRGMGLSYNAFYGSPEIYYQTDAPSYRWRTQQTFCEMWHKGLVLRATRPNNWCIGCQTTLSDAEIEYREDVSTLIYIAFTIKETAEEVLIATTRPELLPTCEVVVFHPYDKRYSHLDGKTAITPLFNKEVPIHTDAQHANPEYGTGVVMICAYGDKDDVAVIRHHGLQPETVVELDGTLGKLAGPYAGMKVKKGRQKIIEDLQSKNLIRRTEETTRRVPTCWRSKDEIEILAQEEWYLQQVGFLGALRDITDEMEFYPPRHQQILVNWINSINIDWPISRRRYYGTPIPIWYCGQCNEAHVPLAEELDRYYEVWKEDPPSSIKECSKCGHLEFRGEERTFDTWFDSSISELIACNYRSFYLEDPDESFFKEAFPCGCRPQGKEIVRTWLYYTTLRSYLLFNKPPFKDVWISGLVMDPYGGKMSKSLGNIIDPLVFIQPDNLPKNTPEIIRPEKENVKRIKSELATHWNLPESKIRLNYGADAVRLTACLQASHGSDIRFSWDKLDGNAKFLSKLFNVARFISSFPLETDSKQLLTVESDSWILKSLDSLIGRCKQGYDALDFSIPAESVYSWIWNIFAPHYLELVKPRAYGTGYSQKDQKSAWATMHTVLRTILKLLAPICPYITEYLHREVYSLKTSIHTEIFPESTQEESVAQITKTLISLNSFVWKAKKQRGLALKSPMKTLWIPKILEPLSDDLKAMHTVDKVLLAPPKGASIQSEEDMGILF
ncbi:MAG: valine--tRNA ligase [Candidatus Heimdallarchaeota archaeon]